MNMKILILNGSPHSNGNTKALVDAFSKGAQNAGHEVVESTFSLLPTEKAM